MIEFISKQDARAQRQRKSEYDFSIFDIISPGVTTAYKIWQRATSSNSQGTNLHAVDESDLKRIISSRLSKILEIGHDIEIISPETASRVYSFDVGHTIRDGAVYFPHPMISERYVSPENFSHLLAQEKEAAFRQRVCPLGG